ncbi:hypothetical protein [Hyphomicrobium denitrificans]|nr:hypothetical protein [Hyphomicrobium denitrificans]
MTPSTALVPAEAQAFTPDLGRYRKWFTAYETNKSDEIQEQLVHEAYYNSTGHWTEEEARKLRIRGQAPIFDNRIARKIDFLVGVEQRMRRDPKGYPRTPNDEQSADVATAGMRYACDINRWDFVGSGGTHDGLVRGIGVCFVGIKQGMTGPDPEIKSVQSDRFFYDPRSKRPDFEDARYMGLHLWMDIDDAKEKWPDKAQQLQQVIDSVAAGGILSRVDQNQETAWAEFESRRVRVVEFWEKTPRGWTYCYFVGEVMLDGGVSPYLDDEGKPDCPYAAWSPYVDERGNRYGPIRSMKPMQDEANHRRSKALHLFTTKQLHFRRGTLEDVDKTRSELAKPDGMIEHDGDWGNEVGIVDHSMDVAGQMQLLEQAQASLENLGPNPGLIGKGGGVADQSGRAILAQRDSGMTELSPVFERNRDWKLRVYRKLWSRIKQSWTAEKWIRITDENDAPQFIGLNQYNIDPQTGQAVSQNVVAMIDVDIIMEEGPDVITMNEELLQTLSQLGPNAVPPKVLIELSNAPNKERLFKMIDEATQPDPVVQQMQQRMARLEQLVQASTVDKNVAQSELYRAQAAAALLTASTPQQQKPMIDKMGNAIPQAPAPMPNLGIAQQALQMFPFHYAQPTIEQYAENASPPQPPADPDDQQQPGEPLPQQNAALPPPSGMPGGLPVNPQIAGMQ